jgi:hypothetical protein
MESSKSLQRVRRLLKQMLAPAQGRRLEPAALGAVPC